MARRSDRQEPDGGGLLIHRGSHRGSLVKRHPNVHFHYTPTHALPTISHTLGSDDQDLAGQKLLRVNDSTAATKAARQTSLGRSTLYREIQADNPDQLRRRPPPIEEGR